MFADALSATPSAPAVAGRRVLLVDDHEPTLHAIAALLESEFPGIVVVGIARTGSEALRLLASERPEVLVLDLDLGGEYGLDLLPELRRWHDLAIVILTASDDPRERRRALAAGAVDFVSKLAPASELVAAIRAAGR